MKLNGEIFLEQFNRYKIRGTAILVSGNELGLIAKIEGLIIKELTNHSMNKEVIFDFKNNKKNNFIDLINSKSLFGNHNVIKIINPMDSLAKSLENINIDNNTIIINGDSVKNNSKIKRFFDSHNKFYSIVCYKLTNKYETLIGDRGIRLSGGQRQRLFIARELFRNPRLLILDEATSALDTKSEKYIQDSIDSLKGKTTVVIIAHRLSTIKNVDNIYVLDNGKVIQSGSFDELRRANDSQFSQMVESQII